MTRKFKIRHDNEWSLSFPSATPNSLKLTSNHQPTLLQYRTEHQEDHHIKHFQSRTSTMSRRALMSVPRALSTISRPTLARAAAPLLRSAATQPQRRSYHEKVLDHYSNPRNVGSMDKSLSDVGTGKSEPSVMKTKFARSQS